MKFHKRESKTYRLRIADRAERAVFDFMASLPRDFVPYDSLQQNARKNIGESAEYLEMNDDKVLQPRDIWIRLI